MSRSPAGVIRRFIITGGVGCGKSTTLSFLKGFGCQVRTEAARRLIERARTAPDIPLPWVDRLAFDRWLIKEMKQDYESVALGTCFFDRGMPDLIGWAMYYGLDYGRYLRTVAGYPYEKKVFFLETREATYVQEEDRPYTFQESREIGRCILEGYQELAYTVVVVPWNPPSRMAREIAGLAKSAL